MLVWTQGITVHLQRTNKFYVPSYHDLSVIYFGVLYFPHKAYYYGPTEWIFSLA